MKHAWVAEQRVKLGVLAEDLAKAEKCLASDRARLKRAHWAEEHQRCGRYVADAALARDMAQSLHDELELSILRVEVVLLRGELETLRSVALPDGTKKAASRSRHVELIERLASTYVSLPITELFETLARVHRGPRHVYHPSEVLRCLSGYNQSDVDQVLRLFAGRGLDLLEQRWLFTDSGGNRWPISPEVIADAVENDYFKHPRTHNPVAGYKQKISLSYVSQELLDNLVQPKEVEA